MHHKILGKRRQVRQRRLMEHVSWPWREVSPKAKILQTSETDFRSAAVLRVIRLCALDLSFFSARADSCSDVIFFSVAHGPLCLAVLHQGPCGVAQPACNLLINQPPAALLTGSLFSLYGPVVLDSCHTTPWRG